MLIQIVTNKFLFVHIKSIKLNEFCRKINFKKNHHKKIKIKFVNKNKQVEIRFKILVSEIVLVLNNLDFIYVKFIS